jgi:hypothetical protein
LFGLCLRLEHSPLRHGAKIDDLIADRNAAAKFLRGIGAAEYREGQILDGEFAVDPIGRLQPAARPRLVRLIQ